MKTRYKIMIFILISISFLGVDLNSQEINLSATVDRNVIGIGETITLTVSVSGNIANVPKPKLPPLGNFDIYSQGTSRNISFINGKVSSSLSYTYSLVPKKMGKFTIGSCELRVKGKTFTTEPIEIEVTKETQKPQSKVPTGRRQRFTFPFEEEPQKPVKRGNDVFIKTHVNKKTVYSGEELILTFKLYSNVNFLSQPEYIPPETKDFWKEDMGKEKQLREVINGREYQVVELKYALFPLTSGKLMIGPAKLNCVIDNFFSNPFSFGVSRGAQKRLVSNPITINVLPLPPSPKGFSGAVGNFEISARLDKGSTKQNEPITLITTIEGNGNLRNIERPGITIPGFRIYDSGSEVKTYESDKQLIERKTFKTILIPNSSGDFEIQGMSFVFFNPKKAKYITATTKGLSFKVLPGKGGKSSEKVFGKKGVEVVGKDIHFIKTEAGLKNEAHLGNLKYFFIMNAILLGTFMWIFISQGVKERMKSKEDIVRKKSALRNALRIIEKAKREAKKDNIKEAYELLHRSILQFFADRSNLSVWGTTEVEIKAYLREMRISDKVEQEIFLLLEACNRARFSKEKPGSERFKGDLDKTVKLLKNLKL